MAISQLTNPVFTSILDNGEANDSGYIYVYTTGGTYNDPADQVTVWSDKAKSSVIPQTSGIQLDSAGQKEIWFDGTVDIRIEKSDTTPVDTIIGIESSPTATITGSFNLVQNGSFEIDTDNDGAPDNWTLAPVTNATIAIDSTSGGQDAGTQGLKITRGGR